MVGELGSVRGTAGGSTLFVGRAPELASFAFQVSRARGGVPAVVVVEGPAGIGKTALVRQALAGAADFQVLAATAEEWESRLAGGVVAQLMAGADDALARQEQRDQEISADPFTTGVELLELLGRLQRHGPVALVVDDAQWADTVSVQAVAFALRRRHRDCVLAVFVAREEAPGLPETLRRLADGEGGVNVHLDGLDPPELAELSSAVRGRTLSHRSAQRLCTHTGGSPLHARALLEELAETCWRIRGRRYPRRSRSPWSSWPAWLPARLTRPSWCRLRRCWGSGAH